MRAKEKLGDENADLIIEELGIPDYDRRNMKCRCPFHREDHASFIYNKKAFSFHCFGACGRSYDLIDAYMANGATYARACQKLFERAGVPYVFGELGVQTRRKYRYPKAEKCSDKSAVYAYFATRKISPKTLDYADVRQDRDGNAVFNYYDTNDVLTMVKYRPSRKIVKGENKCWCQRDADTTPLLFNMNRINAASPLLICEGEADCLAAIESGFINAVSVPFGSGNFHWIEENWDWLEQFESIIICSDNDEAGEKMQKECIYRLGSWRTKTVNVPKTFTLKSGKVFPVNDLNDTLYLYGKEKVLEIILNASDSPVPGVVDFSDIEDLDLDQMDGIPTGLPELDRMLMRLFFGTLTLVTGINGSGKTSLLSQIICQSMDRGDNVYLYSGEMPNRLVRNWMNSIFAGQRNVVECQSNGATFWKVRSETKRLISDFYRGRLFVREEHESNQKTAIFQSMEDVVRKYGAKLIVLDNMTSMDLGSNDNNKYEKQGELIRDLITFAIKYNVAVVLVVHPHKMDMMRRMNKMDVQGLSAVIDLAHRIISLYRVQAQDRNGEQARDGSWKKEPVKWDVLIDILKDRLTGRENGVVGVYYDKPSKRFFTNERDLDWRYSWDKAQYCGPLPFPPKQVENQDEDEVFGSAS